MLILFWVWQAPSPYIAFDLRLLLLSHLHSKTFLQCAFRGAALFQQFVVNIWMSTEMSRLQYYYFYQKELRCDLYDTARRQFLGDQDVSTSGRCIVFLLLFVTSPAHTMSSYVSFNGIMMILTARGYNY